MFCCQFCKIIKSNFFIEHFRATASENISHNSFFFHEIGSVCVSTFWVAKLRACVPTWLYILRAFTSYVSSLRVYLATCLCVSRAYVPMSVYVTCLCPFTSWTPLGHFTTLCMKGLSSKWVKTTDSCEND